MVSSESVPLSLGRGLTASSARMASISPGVETETDGARQHGRPNGGTDTAPEEQHDAGEDTPVFPLENAPPSQPSPGFPSDRSSAPPPYIP